MKSNLYAKYYFELRELFKHCEYEFPLKPLSKFDEDRLELNSIVFKDRLGNNINVTVNEEGQQENGEGKEPGKKRSNSFGGSTSKPMWE